MTNTHLGLSKARAWREQLETAPPKTISGLAVWRGVTAAYFTRVLRIAYLAPGIFEVIFEGGIHLS